MFRGSWGRALGVLALVTAGLAGCGKLNPGGGVAVFELDRALQESGLLARVNGQTEQVRQRMQSQVNQLQQQLKAELGSAQEAMGEEPGEEQQAEYQRKVQAANQRLAQARQRANGIIDNRRSQFMAQARGRIRPVARQVAEGRGAKAVFLAGTPALFDYNDGIDITDAVVAELRSRRAAARPPAASAGEGQGQAQKGPPPQGAKQSENGESR